MRERGGMGWSHPGAGTHTHTGRERLREMGGDLVSHNRQ